MHYLLFYDYVEDVLERRAAFRDEHLRLVRESHARGELLMAGAYAEPPYGALLVFRCDDPGRVEAFVAGDPYVKNEIVTGWRIRAWQVPVGG